jgi:S-DNA-T family DNA segregation ATPase FtsK/SpoIIIE
VSRKPDVPPERLKPELAGVGLFVAGLLVLASLVLHAQHSHAYIPAAVAEALRFLVGSGAYLIGAALLIVGLMALLGVTEVLNARILGALGLFFLCFLLARHIGVPRGGEFEPLAVQRGGGILGASLWWAASRSLGTICTWIVLAGVLLVAGVLFTQGQAVASAGVLARGAGAGSRWLLGRVQAGHAEVKRRRKEASERPKPAPAKAAAPPPAGSHIIDISAEIAQEKPPEPSTEPTPPKEPEPAVAVAQVAPAPDPAMPDPIPLPPTSVVKPPPRAPRPVTPSAAVPSAAGYHRPEQLALLSKSELYQPPPLSLISEFDSEAPAQEDDAQAQARIALLEDTLDSFGIQAKVRHYVRGPAVTRYEVEPVRGIRVSRVASLADDLALAFAAAHVRVEAPVPGKSLIGIEVPNSEVGIVGLRGILATDTYRHAKSLLVVAIGRDIAGTPVLADLSRMPHLLIAGATNAGKTISLHSIITSLLMRARPEQVKLILIDPKRVELMMYDGIPHLMAPVVQTAPHAADVLRKVIREMEHRYDLFAMKGVVNITEYNELAAMPKEDEDEDFDPLPYVVVIIDELADLMMQAKAEFEYSICRIAQLARATGIHLVIATQRPSVNVITGTIKANIPSRIALSVVSQHDSRTIIDGQGAERLIGRGDMLYRPADASKGRRVQGAYISRHDLEAIVAYLRDQGEPDYDIIPEVQDDMAGYGDESEPSDELYEKAVELVAGAQEASVSMLQRRFKIGYARAGRLVDMMEERGVVGPSEGSKARKVLVPPGYTVHGPALYAQEEGGEVLGETEVELMDLPADEHAVLVPDDGAEG